MDGFGVSQALGRAAEFRALSATPRKKGLDYLFSTTTGAGLSMIRNRIGSGGYGDSILPSSPGSPNGTRQYVWDGDDRGQVWFSKEAQQYGVTAVYSDAWSAPGFMKTNGDESNGGYPCSTTEHTCSSGDWRQAYANMLAQYIKYYQQEGIQVTHLGFLNEPDYTYVPRLLGRSHRTNSNGQNFILFNELECSGSCFFHPHLIQYSEVQQPRGHYDSLL